MGRCVTCNWTKLVIFLILAYLVLRVTEIHFDDYIRSRTSAVSFNVSQWFASDDLAITEKTLTDGPVKILEVAYMRGGSSLFGQLFYQDPQAFYWYESLAGVYSELYGVMPALVALKLSHYINGTARNVEGFELQAVIDSIDAMLSCNLNNLSVHVLTHTFMFNGGEDHSYIQCLESPNKQLTARPLRPVHHDSYTDCQRILSPVCLFAQDLPTHCYDELRQPDPDSLFVKNKACLLYLEKTMNVCVDYLEKDCNQSSIRAMKALRINMKTVSRLLEELPDVKVVHYVRDPRGIVHSRMSNSMLSPQSKQSALREADLLCGKMLENIEIFRQLQMKYPDRLLQLRYEDLVTLPEITTTQLYEFMGKQKSHVVEKWLEHTMNASDDSGSFSYKRTNGTATALAWKDSLSTDFVIGITCLCGEVLKELKYPLVV